MTQPTFYARSGKRLFDVAVASMLLTAAAPVLAVVGLAIRAMSGRPVVFRQERVGRNGEVFELFKFRTMVVGTHEASGGYPDTSMVTPIGRFLRKTSMDEMPQLVNIVRGNMSLVGPRPGLPEQALRYTSSQRRRLTVRPGVTGLAQVRYRNNAPWSARIQADLEYIDTMSFREDLKILARTLPAVFLGAGVMTGQSAADVDDLVGDE